MSCNVTDVSMEQQPTGFKASPEATAFGLRNIIHHSVSLVNQYMAYDYELRFHYVSNMWHAISFILCNAWQMPH